MPTVVILASTGLSLMYISVLTASGSRLDGGGVKGDSYSQSPNCRLHHLLIQGCWLTPGKWKWLADGWCNLRNLWRQTLLLKVAFSCLPLLLGGLYDRVVSGCWGIEVSHGDVSQMEIPGGGGTSLDIPPKEVLRVVDPPEEAVVPQPGVCYIVWLHEGRGANGGTPGHLQFVSG